MLQAMGRCWEGGLRKSALSCLVSEPTPEADRRPAGSISWVRCAGGRRGGMRRSALRGDLLRGTRERPALPLSLCTSVRLTGADSRSGAIYDCRDRGVRSDPGEAET